MAVKKSTETFISGFTQSTSCFFLRGFCSIILHWLFGSNRTLRGNNVSTSDCHVLENTSCIKCNFNFICLPSPLKKYAEVLWSVLCKVPCYTSLLYLASTVLLPCCIVLFWKENFLKHNTAQYFLKILFLYISNKFSIITN
jgi:hypothetical protein